MTQFAAYLDGVKAKKGIKNDNQFAIKIGIPQPTIQTWKTTGRVPSDEACIKIAEFAGDDPAQVILLARMSGAKGETKKHWDKIFKAVLTAGITVLLFVFQFTETVYYVKCRRRFNLAFPASY